MLRLLLLAPLALFLAACASHGNVVTKCGKGVYAVSAAPKHPYTQALLSSVPRLDPSKRTKRIVLGGDVPSPISPPTGCPFHPRCPIAESRCKSEVPSLTDKGHGHMAACHLT